MSKALEFSFYICVRGCWWPSSSSVVCSGILVCPIWKSSPNLYSVDDSTTWRSTWYWVWIWPLFVVFLGFLEGSADIKLKNIDHPLCFLILVR